MVAYDKVQAGFGSLWVSTDNVLKSLSRETKALVLVSEYEARRMPMFQMRAVLNAIVANEEEKKIVIDLIENDLKATGYHPNQINTFLQDLLAEEPAAQPAAAETGVRVTRRLRSPFAMGFDDQPVGLRPSGGQPVSGVHPAAAPAPGPTVSVSGQVTLPPAPAIPPVPAAPPVPGSGSRHQTAGTVGSGSRHAAVTKPNLGQQGTRVSNTVVQGLPRPQVPGAMPRPSESNAGNAAVDAPKVRSGGVAGTADRDEVFFGSRPAGGVGGTADSKPRVLLADDDKRIRIVFRLTIERLGYTVVEASDGNEAWKRIQQGGLTLAILDMKMPGLHGLEVLQRMVDQSMDLPIVICSAYDQLKDEFVVATYPKLRYLVKPVSSEALERAIKDLVGTIAAE